MLIQPKPFLDKLKLRNDSVGVERRRNLSKIMLDHMPNFPLTIEYSDIDRAFENWVTNDLEISYNGIKFPTFKMFSNQRISEYAQNWHHLDEVGNLILNFKTITREPNPSHGENQGKIYNIPGDRFYPMFVVPVLQENGQYAYNMYSMKQPYCVDLVYTVSIVTNKYDLINQMNMIINDKFKSINCYIAPNNHYMPMMLDNVSDESEYDLQDRKYYSQSFKIKVKAYIIRETDYQVTKLPSKAIVRLVGSNNHKKTKVQIQEDYIADDCCLITEKSTYVNKKIKIIIDFPICDKTAEFVIDTDVSIKEISNHNIYDFIIWVNGEKQDLTSEVKIYNGDKIKISIGRNEYDQPSSMEILGDDFNTIIDTSLDIESSLDEPTYEETYKYDA